MAAPAILSLGVPGTVQISSRKVTILSVRVPGACSVNLQLASSWVELQMLCDIWIRIQSDFYKSEKRSEVNQMAFNREKCSPALRREQAHA